MGKAYRIPSETDRLRKQQIQIRNLQALNRNRNTPRPVATTAFTGVSAGGGSGGTGNFLATKGDTMTGPFALGPPVDFSIEIDANGVIDIGESSSNSQYSSNIQLEDIQPNTFTLDTIAGAAFDGQILILRTFAPSSTFTIAAGTVGNDGNIQTPDSNDVTGVGDLQMIVFVFDASLIINNNTGGTWRLLNTFGTGGGGIAFPIRPPVTTGLPTTGNVVLDLNQTSGHYFTIGPLTGNIDIDITNPPAANIAQAFRINITKGATDFTVTFNDTLLVQPFIGEENTVTLLAGDIYDGSVFNIFTMTSTAGSGSPTELWATFPAVSDVDFATFDGINVDRFLFALDSGTFGSASDVGFVRSSAGLLANVPTEQGHFWLANLETIMSVNQIVTSNNTILDVIAPAIDGAVPNIRTFALDSTPTVDTAISRMEFIAKNNAAENIAYAGLQTDIEGITDGSEEGSLSLIARSAGSFVTFMSMNDTADGKITSFRDLHMDTGRNIELVGNKIYANITSDNTFITGDATSFQFFIADAGSAKGTFGTDKLLLANNYFIQSQVVEHRALVGSDPSTIDGAIWYRSDTDEIKAQLFSGVVTLGGGADNALSNLTSPTAINQDLDPGTTGTLDIGNDSFVWDALTVLTVRNAVTLALVAPIVSIPGASLLIGDAVTDKVAFISRIDSNFTPLTDNTRDLGEGGLEWRNLRIGGTASINTLSNSVPIIVTQDLDLGTNVVIDYDSSITSTSASAGVNGDVPSQVIGYITIQIDGANAKVPFYGV